ncbi:TonB-dependent receptor [Bordetella genomosp. 12]|uniref:TonB-dependent siderophore receptor n=1 Tax=Bordetella genomosp. 12 TaxID=463035 RepID=A0A261VTZ1_9BORD|nr:TonB-dependent receptor [Bordetella genomosp. 12]OZI77297.1 TonB-dependent siderophore receptor [Bordetella genomosp. 12]
MLRRRFLRHPFVRTPRTAVRPLALALHLSLTAGVLAASAVPLAAQAADRAPIRRYDIPAGSLNTVLNRFAEEAGVLLSAPGSLTAGKTSAGLQGDYGVEAGLTALLSGHGLQALRQPDGVYFLREAPIAAGATVLSAVAVTANGGAHTPPEAYAGGQVARGSRMGVLGNTDVMDTPFNTTSYTAELMENQQALTVADVLANDPSVRTVSYGLTNSAAGGEVFMIRGLSVQDSILLDGVPGIISSRAGAVELAERVELLKGPSALLNGMALGAGGAVGGAINMVTKHAPDQPLTRLTTTYLSDGNLGAHVDVGRRFGEDDAWGIRVNALYRDGDTATAGQSVELGAAAIGLDYRSATLRASLDVGHQTMNNKAPQGAAGFGIDDGLPIPTPPKATQRLAQDWEYAKSRSNYVLAQAEYDLNANWSVFGAAGASKTRSSYLSSDIYVTDSAGNAQASVYYWPNWIENRVVQAGLRGSFATGATQHRVSLSGTYLTSDTGYTNAYYGFSSFATNIYDPASVSRPSTAGFDSDPPRTNRVQLPSLAATDTLSWLDDRISLTVGARYQRVKNTVRDTGIGVAAATYDRHALTPVLAAVVKPLPDLSIYGNYIEGLIQGDTAPMGTTNAGQMFAPVKVKQREIGVKYDFGSVSSTLSLFQIEKPSGLAMDNGDGTSTYRVGMEQRNRGVELNLFGELARGVRLLGGVAYIQPKITKNAYSGNTAPNVSRWQLNLGGEYDLPAIPGLTLSARMISTSPQYLDEANARSIPGWTRWDFGARYTTRAWEHPLVLRAGINNAFGRNYWSGSSGNWLYLGQPRTFTLSATMDF